MDASSREANPAMWETSRREEGPIGEAHRNRFAESGGDGQRRRGGPVTRCQALSDLLQGSDGKLGELDEDRPSLYSVATTETLPQGKDKYGSTPC